MWRVCHDILPTRLNLVRRKVTEESWCPVCEGEEESLIHALWECPATTYVWGEMARPLGKWSNKAHEIWDLSLMVENR